jgi:hypothetical protein
LTVTHLQCSISNLNTILFDTNSSSGTNRNQHGRDNVNMNSGDEIVHDTHIANQMLHDDFEREYTHEEDMDREMQAMALKIIN